MATFYKIIMNAERLYPDLFNLQHWIYCKQARFTVIFRVFTVYTRLLTFLIKFCNESESPESRHQDHTTANLHFIFYQFFDYVASIA